MHIIIVPVNRKEMIIWLTIQQILALEWIVN